MNVLCRLAENDIIPKERY